MHDWLVPAMVALPSGRVIWISKWLIESNVLHIQWTLSHRKMVQCGIKVWKRTDHMCDPKRTSKDIMLIKRDQKQRHGTMYVIRYLQQKMSCVPIRRCISHIPLPRPFWSTHALIHWKCSSVTFFNAIFFCHEWHAVCWFFLQHQANTILLCVERN